jgi:GntR family transcriptional regulator
MLELPAGVAAFAIDRLGFVRERTVEWRSTLVRGDRFSIVAEFAAGIGYRLNLRALAS